MHPARYKKAAGKNDSSRVLASSAEPTALTRHQGALGSLRVLLRTLPLACSIFILTQGLAEATSYKVDPEHTSVTFTVRHLFTRVQGRFDRFEGTIVFDPKNPEKTKVSGSIYVVSVNTNVAERDNDLRSENFFYAEKYPKITFKSTKISAINPKSRTAKVHGDLTIRGVTRPVVIDAAYLGAGKDPWGNVRAGFSASLTINRKDFGLTWNEVLETGGVLVGDEVTIRLEVEGTVVE